MSIATIEALLARAEADLEQARRPYEIARALAEDWAYWEPLLGAPTKSVEEHEAVAEPPAQADAVASVPKAPTAPQSACRHCGGPLPPRAGGFGGRPKVFCSKACGSKWHAARQYERKMAARRAAELASDPVPDMRPEERPLFVPDQHEDPWLTQQLRPPPLPWEQAPAH